jgi:hypothetical protein
MFHGDGYGSRPSLLLRRACVNRLSSRVTAEGVHAGVMVAIAGRSTAVERVVGGGARAVVLLREKGSWCRTCGV